MVQGLKFNEFGVSTQTNGQILQIISQQTDVIYLADTKHADPKVKGAAFNMLLELKDEGFSLMWLEVSHKKQESFDKVLAANPNAQTVTQWFIEEANLKSKLVMAEGANSARSLGIEVGFIDDRKPAIDFRKANPDFASHRKEFNQLRRDGHSITESHNAITDKLDDAGREKYWATRTEWQKVRDKSDDFWAKKVIGSLEKHPKQIIVGGDGHINTLDDVDDKLQANGLKVTTFHVCPNLASYGEYLALYLDKEPVDGNQRKTPDLLVMSDSGLILDANNENLKDMARKAYKLQELGIYRDSNLPGTKGDIELE